jgi:predicted dehydrogenase
MANVQINALKPIHVVFIGLNHLHPRSYRLLFGYLPAVHVVAAAETDASLLDTFARDFSLRAYSDWRALIDREAIDLAVLFLPHADCPEAAVACAERGIHILVEKPMAAQSAGIRRMIDAACKAGVALSSPFVWRYHTVSLALKEMIAGAVLGEVFSGVGRYADGRPHRHTQGGVEWMMRKARSGGGPMHSLGVHWIDLFRWLLEDEVVEVMGRTIRWDRPCDVEDAALALITFSRGAVIALDVSYSLPGCYPGGRDLFISLRGRSGQASWHPSLDERKQRLHVCSDAPGPQMPGCRDIEYAYPVHPGYAGPCGKAFLEDLIGAIREGRTPPITGEDGLRALEVVEAIYLSAESGAAVHLNHNKKTIP